MASTSAHLLLFFLLTTSYATSAESSSKKTISSPQLNVTKNLFFQDFDPNNPTVNQDITLLGSAALSTQKGCIQIPEYTLPYSAGRAIYSSPVRLFDPTTQAPASFQTTFSFQFYGPSNVSGSNSGGLSFIVASDEFTIGRHDPWIGTQDDGCDDEYKAVAVVLDARVKPELGHSKGKVHVGVNMGSMVSTIAVNAMDFGVHLDDGSVYRAWIVYDGTEKSIHIFLGPDGTEPTTQIYSGDLDLSPYLNEYMFVGFSAASTGNNLTQVYSVCSWNFTSVSRAFLRVTSTETCDSKIRMENEGNSTGNAHRKTPSIFLIFLAVAVLVLAIMISLLMIGRREKSSDEMVVAAELNVGSPMPPNRARKFTFSEISSITQGFGQLQVLGGDSRSVTYKGTFSNGCKVAVKRYSDHFFSSSASERRRMRKEVKEMAKIRHPNLVSIRGWCFDRQETIIVYDFIPNGSLDKWLFGFGELPWTRRFKVIKDVAEALSYVHSKELAHKNVKTSSVLVDVSFRAVVGDYGFVLSSTESAQFEALVSQKVDVFEFGVLMLEVVSGRGRRSDPGKVGLLDLAWAMHESGEKAKLVDKRMGSAVNADQAIRVLEVGLMCTLNDNKGRPSMEQVVDYLNVERPVPELPSSRPVSLFPYSSATGLCSGYSCASFK
ncbi:L-type lectin-domain containing receptor kinase VIII.1-like isoform X1 [Henckelia pumila]|uniref:L-type lectin-domain containing receptor kinase VIII.1-like isoform X1 n=1 Tax=Henckelia pumila TaxID=405737 RepID=UPI003C6E3968